MDFDALVTAPEAASRIPSVSRLLIAKWVQLGKLEPKGRRGRSPLYRWGDILDVERSTRLYPAGRRRKSKSELLAA